MLIDKRNLTLSGERLTLRPLKNNNVTETYLSWLNDPELQKFTRRRNKKLSMQGLRDFVAQSQTSTDWHFAIIDENKEHIGNIFLNHVDSENNNADLSIMIGALSAHGKGYAKEAIQLVTDFAFNELKLHRLYAGSPNPAFNKMIKKMGWTHEGESRECFLVDGTYYDMTRWGILKYEWKKYYE